MTNTAKVTQPHVVAVLPRGETFRNFIYSGALDTLRQQAKVTLITVIPDESYRKQMQQRFDGVYELTVAPERWLVRWLRQELDVVHGRHLWSAAAQNRWRHRDAEAVTPFQKTKRLVSKSLSLAFANQLGVQLFSHAERQASRAFNTDSHYLELLKKLRPTLVFNASHVHSANATQAIQAAQWLGVPTATFLFSWDNLTSQGRIMLPYDYYLAWNQDIAEQLLEIYPQVTRQQVYVTGTPQFDFHFRPEFHESRETFCQRVGLDPARPYVLYSTGMDNHMPGEPLIIERIMEMLRAMPEKPQLLVRLYPKDHHPERFDEMRRRNPGICFPAIPWNRAYLTPEFEDCSLLTNTLRHCTLGINVASTVSLELAMFDKPVINVGYNPPGLHIAPTDYRVYYEFDHYRPLVESGMLRVARDETEMRDWLKLYFGNPHTDREARQGFIQQMFGATLDGQTAYRVAAVLAQLAQS
jgi:hypothetical protein